jgi:hypothetical protein
LGWVHNLRNERWHRVATNTSEGVRPVVMALLV